MTAVSEQQRMAYIAGQAADARVNVEQIPAHLDPKNQPAPEPAAAPAEPEASVAAPPAEQPVPAEGEAAG